MKPGIHWFVYNRAKPTYIKNMNTNYEFDKYVAEMLNLKSILLVPLIVRGQVIAIVDFVARNQKLNLKLSQVNKIGNICEQIAGAVYTSSLFEKVNDERSKVLEAQAQIKKLNKVSSNIAKAGDISKSLGYIFDYIRDNFNLQYGLLALVDNINNCLIFYKPHLIPHFSEKTKQFLLKARVPISSEGGIIGMAVMQKKTIYIGKLSSKYLNHFDFELARQLQLSSFSITPLKVLNNVFAIILLTNLQKPMDIDRAALKKISLFLDQISGSIKSSILLMDIKKDQALMERARWDAEVAHEKAEEEKVKSQTLLSNILPNKIADELIEKGEVTPQKFNEVSIIFTDFKGFTKSVARMQPYALVKKLDAIFGQFDKICERHNIEKIKTIGDAYMCAGGLPEQNETHYIDACLAALEMRFFIQEIMSFRTEVTDDDFWETRIGIHNGPVIAGVVGIKKFAYDMWGDTVNIASRMESGGEAGKINISEDLYAKAQKFLVI